MWVVGEGAKRLVERKWHGGSRGDGADVFYYCPLNMFLCRIIRFLAKDKPPLKR